MSVAAAKALRKPATLPPGPPADAAEIAGTPTAPPVAAPLHWFQEVPLDNIQESKTNPRKTFKAIDELADSIRVQGVAQPILVRPLWVTRQGAHVAATQETLDSFPGARANMLFELVAGARRCRAARVAGLTAIPAIVRDLDDRAALEIQVIENDQREDVQPIDQALGYLALINQGYTAADIAAKIGRDETYVYRRLQLTKLIAPFQKLLQDEAMPFAAAVIVARLSEGNQRELEKTRKRVANDDNKWPWSMRDLRFMIDREFHVRLKDAIWKLDDADLHPKAGPCVGCTKNTGHNKALFDDVKDDTCTDRECFNTKRAAFVQMQITRAKEAAGGEVLKVTTEYYNYTGDKSVLGRDQYSEVSAKEAKKLPAKDVKRAVVVDGEGLGRTMLVKVEKDRTSTSGGPSAADKARRKKVAELAGLQADLLDQILAGIKSPAGVDTLRVVLRTLVDRTGSDTMRRLAPRRKWERKRKDDYRWMENGARAEIAALGEVELHRFAVELALAGTLGVSQWGELKLDEKLAEAAKAYGIDVEKVRAERKALEKAELKRGQIVVWKSDEQTPLRLLGALDTTHATCAYTNGTQKHFPLAALMPAGRKLVEYFEANEKKPAAPAAAEQPAREWPAVGTIVANVSTGDVGEVESFAPSTDLVVRLADGNTMAWAVSQAMPASSTQALAFAAAKKKAAAKAKPAGGKKSKNTRPLIELSDEELDAMADDEPHDHDDVDDEE